MSLYIGIAIALVAIVAVSILSGKTAKSKKGANAYLVAGAVMGTLVGGASTIGTAQLAYQYGMSAWWFTLGGGISCLILAAFYAKPFRESGNKTLAAIVASPVTVLLLNLVGGFPIDPLFAGVFLSAIIMLAGYFMKQSQKENEK